MRHSPPITARSLEDLLARTDHLLRRRARVLIGVAGEPGAGKSTLATDLARALGSDAVVIPMDGYHLAQSQLAGTALAARKGAIDTFDLAGYRSLLGRIRGGGDGTVYAPAYLRELEEPVAGSVAVPPGIRTIITEGNYLLADHPDMAAVRGLLDDVWFVEVDPALRRRRLIERHVRFGKAPADAVAWADGSDEDNARLVRAGRRHAHVIVNLAPEVERTFAPTSRRH